MVNFEAIVGKLNDPCFRAMENSVALCQSRRNYYVEIEHLLLKLLEDTQLDLSKILNHFQIDPTRVQVELTRSLERLDSGSRATPLFSETLIEWLREAWLLASLDYNAQRLRSGHLLLALLSHRGLSRHARVASALLSSISSDVLQEKLLEITQGTVEDYTPVDQADAGNSLADPTGKSAALDKFTIDLTAQARAGKIDPILGRDFEIRQVIDILTRRRQNNAILTGEAGVGKTAVAEGFALRVAAGDVPLPLRKVSVKSLDIGLLQAGAGVRGEFEARLKAVIDEIKSSPNPVILFIDEAHTLIGAGGAAGQGDAANLLKPALARGELRAIAATTWAEYKKYFESDAALARRFQVVKIEEPSPETTVAMMRGLVDTLERHHSVRILSEAVVDAARLSDRYVTGRQLPDKAVSVLDTACARIALSQNATPAAIDDIRRSLDLAQTAIAILEREAASGADHSEELERLRGRTAKDRAELQALESRWEQEKQLVSRVQELRTQLESQVRPAAGDIAGSPAVPSLKVPGELKTTPDTTSREELLAELLTVERKLTALQGETPLVHPCVNSQAIAETVASWTGIPIGRMMSDEIRTVMNLKSLMEESIVGQSHALDLIARSIQTSRANLTDPVKPIGVFLLAGTSGVGKTETAITLANMLYGGEQNMTSINMSEFKEEHKVSLLMGSPPGYVGYGEGGVLTEAVRRKPYSVVLLDEMEKAHPGVQDIFYQVFDKGTLKDGTGRDIDFRNTVILLATNAGSETIKELCKDPELRPEPEAFAEAVFPELLKWFKPAFLGRVKIVPYYPLADDVLRSIVRLKVGKIAKRVREHYRAELTFSDSFADEIARRCNESDIGARQIDNLLAKTLQPELAAQFLARLASQQPFSRATVSVLEDGKFDYKIS